MWWADFWLYIPFRAASLSSNSYGVYFKGISSAIMYIHSIRLFLNAPKLNFKPALCFMANVLSVDFRAALYNIEP